VLVGGESKLGSTEDDPVDGDMTKFQPHSHGDRSATDDDERPIPWRYAFDTHNTEGSNWIYGLTHKACWAHNRILPRLTGSVNESHIHLPEPNVARCSLSLSVFYTILMYVHLSLNHTLSYILQCNLLWHCSELYHHRAIPTMASDGIVWGNAIEVGDCEGWIGEH
jgi:hypothetical protein